LPRGISRDFPFHHIAILLLIDKNSLPGGLNIQKGQLCVKGNLAQDLGFVWGLFRGDSGDFLGRALTLIGIDPLMLRKNNPGRSTSGYISIGIATMLKNQIVE